MPVPVYLMRNHVEDRVITLGGGPIRKWQREAIAARLAAIVSPDQLGSYSVSANDNPVDLLRETSAR